MAEILFTGFIFDIVVIAVSFLVLNWASNLAINNALKVATISQLGKTAVGFSLIAFSTSLPELTVAFIAAFSGGAALSVGNVIGSNVVNISVVLGLATILLYIKSRRKRTNATSSNGINLLPNFAKSELSNIHFGLFISSIIPMILIYVQAATWIVGIVLITIFVVYMYQLSKIRMPSENGEVTLEEKNKLKKYALLTIAGALGVVAECLFPCRICCRHCHFSWDISTSYRCNNNCLRNQPPRNNLRFESFLKRSLWPCIWGHNWK